MGDNRKKNQTLDEVWNDPEKGLLHGLNVVFELPGSKERPSLTAATYMEQYTAVHNFCTQSKPTSPGKPQAKGQGASLVGRSLYDKMIEFLQNYLAIWLNELRPRRDDDLLRFFADMWQRYTFSSRVSNNMWTYLNRHWVPRAKEEDKGDGYPIHEIYRLCLMQLKDVAFEPLREAIFDAMMTLVTRARDGEVVNTQLMRNITDLLVALGYEDDDDDDTHESSVNGQLAVYRRAFEEGFLTQTSEYYRAESGKFLEENSLTEYMKKATARIEEESRRVEAYLHESTRDKLMQVCEKVLVDEHKERIAGEFRPLLTAVKTDDLRRMYDLMNRIDALDPLRDNLEVHVFENGIAAVARIMAQLKEGSLPDPKAYVDCLLMVYKQSAEVVEKAFNNDATFVAAMDRGCKKFVNENAATAAKKGSKAASAELLAKYCHSLLKKGSKTAEGQDIEQLLDGAMVVFQYIEDKDIFQKFYKKFLAKRLVDSNSESDNFETSMLSKLRDKCGFEWTNDFQRMFTDVSNSRDMMGKYKESALSKQALKKFDIMVLQTNAWPLSDDNKSEIALPEVLRKCQEKFTLFYNQQHQGRKLSWLYHLGYCEVETLYTHKKESTTLQKHTLVTNTLQLLVLLNFENADELTVADLKELTKIEDSKMTSVVESLCKHKLLKQKSEGVLSLNVDFRNKKTKVNIKGATKREGDKEREEVEKSVSEDRQYFLQAVIVRNMKSRKTMTHSQLQTSVMDQVSKRFKPDPRMIKKQISVLIDKDYIARSEGDRNTLVYLA